MSQPSDIYDIQADDGIPVKLPSGANYYVLTDAEARELRDKVDRYLNDNHFVNVSDMQEIDRMVIFELMIYRWNLWMARGKDYWNDLVDPKKFHDMINVYCVDHETEILTERGWLHYDEVAEGDLALTLTPSGLAEWQPVEHVHTFIVPSATEIRTRDHHSVTTGNHRWPVRRLNQQRLSWKTTETLDRRDALVLHAPGAVATSPKWSDSFVELVAWYWTEGGSGPTGYCARIHQSWQVNAGNVARIEAACHAEWGPPGKLSHHPDVDGGPLWNRCDLPSGRTEFRLARDAAQAIYAVLSDRRTKVVSPEFLTQLTQAQLELFIDTSIRGDGWVVPGRVAGTEYRYISQRNPERNRSFEIACALAGKPVRTVFEPYTGMWRTTVLAERSYVPLRRGARAQVHGPLLVWCPETANGTWFARRSGYSYFTGNSKEVRLIKKALGLDKATRDRTRGDDSIAALWDNLLTRAREFGYMRNEQLEQTITSFQRIKAMITLHKNTDEIERKENACELADVLEVIEDEIAKFDAIDEKFRFEKQRLWVRKQ